MVVIHLAHIGDWCSPTVQTQIAILRRKNQKQRCNTWMQKACTSILWSFDFESAAGCLEVFLSVCSLMVLIHNFEN